MLKQQIMNMPVMCDILEQSNDMQSCIKAAHHYLQYSPLQIVVSCQWSFSILVGFVIDGILVAFSFIEETWLGCAHPPSFPKYQMSSERVKLATVIHHMYICFFLLGAKPPVEQVKLLPRWRRVRFFTNMPVSPKPLFYTGSH